MVVPTVILSRMDFTLEKKIGLSWTFMQNPTDFYNKSYLMINGFGINVLPGAIGLTLGGIIKILLLPA